MRRKKYGFKISAAMRRRNTSALMGAVLLLMSSLACADLSTCEDLYVGRIWVEKGLGLKAVVLLNQPSDTTGSYWSFFDQWSADERKAALALLTSAKLAQHRVNVLTDNADQCGIGAGGTYMKAVFLATNP